MLLVVNIGNTNIRFGIYEKDHCNNSWVINTKPFKSKDELKLLFKNMYSQYGLDESLVTKIGIGSVVPQQTAFVQQALEEIHKIKPIVLDRNTPTEVKFSSKEIGTDLYANAVAAHYLYPGQTKIVIDFGTALTFLGINKEGEILGVAIAPGVITSLNALVSNTAQLPEIEFKKTPKVLNNNTVECMQSGVVNGFLSMVEGMIDKIDLELAEKPLVISTGGMSFVYKPMTDKININNKLHTLEGLKKMYEVNY